MKESTDNGCDFEMQELERLQLQRIKDKITATKPNGWKIVNTTLLTEHEKKIYLNSLGNSNEEDDYDRWKRINENNQYKERLRNEYNYLNGK
ncbi:MAG TPA: hypothetical protein PK649_12225 [Vicingus sp.]|nr:hypothetical protein [Vicingus sp.]